MSDTQHKREKLLSFAEKQKTKKYLGQELTTPQILQMTAEDIHQYYNMIDSRLKTRIMSNIRTLLMRHICCK